MSHNSFGHLFRVTTWGESHGVAIGCVVDGCPPLLKLDETDIQPWLDRRRPGQSKYTTQRQEPDEVRILSGVFEGRTTGTPISLEIQNVDQRSKDYGAIAQQFRPGHADLTYELKYGIRDYRGGGRSSARETASRVAAGAVARLVLGDEVRVRGALVQIGDRRIDRARWDWLQVGENPFFCPDAETVALWEQDLAEVRKAGSSVGAVIEVVAEGVPPGLGAPIYGKLDADLAGALMGINAVKGVEIGDGFASAASRGEDNADEMRMEAGTVRFAANHAGGVLGGISTGQPIVARFAVKPTSSILSALHSVDRSGADVDIATKGRHDPCVGIRAVPVGEAMVACVLADHLLRHRAQEPVCADSRSVAAELSWLMATSNLTAGLADFIAICGARVWRQRMAALRNAAEPTNREHKGLLQSHAIELVIDRLARGRPNRRLSPAEELITTYATDAVRLHEQLSAGGRQRFEAVLGESLSGSNGFIGVFHLMRTAALQRSRQFEVAFAGFDDDAPFDLLIRRGTAEAEIACDVVSAEDGRGVHRCAWFRLVDRIDPELQTWLRAHPGRYLLKLTFPLGLKLPGCDESGLLPALHERITRMLSEQRRADSDPAVVLRLDPLMLAAAQADELGLMPRLREEFGPEAHLAVSTGTGGIFVLAARAGQQNEIAIAVRRRMAAIVPQRLTGTRPGILAMFIEDTDRSEWRLLREKLELEGEARQFLTNPTARGVVAVTCCSRLELFGIGEPDAAPGGELRFRNQAHPAAKQIDLAPAVASSI